MQPKTTDDTTSVTPKGVNINGNNTTNVEKQLPKVDPITLEQRGYLTQALTIFGFPFIILAGGYAAIKLGEAYTNEHGAFDASNWDVFKDGNFYAANVIESIGGNIVLIPAKLLYNTLLNTLKYKPEQVENINSLSPKQKAGIKSAFAQIVINTVVKFGGPGAFLFTINGFLSTATMLTIKRLFEFGYSSDKATYFAGNIAPFATGAMQGGAFWAMTKKMLKLDLPLTTVLQVAGVFVGFTYEYAANQLAESYIAHFNIQDKKEQGEIKQAAVLLVTFMASMAPAVATYGFDGLAALGKYGYSLFKPLVDKCRGKDEEKQNLLINGEAEENKTNYGGTDDSTNDSAVKPQQ